MPLKNEPVVVEFGGRLAPISSDVVLIWDGCAQDLGTLVRELPVDVVRHHAVRVEHRDHV